MILNVTLESQLTAYQKQENFCQFVFLLLIGNLFSRMNEIVMDCNFFFLVVDGTRQVMLLMPGVLYNLFTNCVK